MNVERFCTVCNIKIVSNIYLKDRTVCRSFYNKDRKNNTLIQNEINTSHQQRKIENANNKGNNVNNPSVSTYESHAYVVIGQRNVGKTYYMLKILEKKGNERPIHIITRSPNQYPNYITRNEIKPINKYKRPVAIIDDMLGARNSSQIDDFFTRGRLEYLDVYYFSQSYFALLRQSIRNNSDRLILFEQTLRDVESMYKDIGGYDMKYVEFKEMCRKAWSEKFIHICIDVSKNRNEDNYHIFKENENRYIECIFEIEVF